MRIHYVLSIALVAVSIQAVASAHAGSPLRPAPLHQRLLRAAALGATIVTATSGPLPLAEQARAASPRATRPAEKLQASKYPSASAAREKAIRAATAWKEHELRRIGDPKRYLERVARSEERMLERHRDSPYFARSQESHRVRFLGTGIQGMAAHLELIRNSDRVSLQYYFFDQSPSARIVLNALIDRCRADASFRAEILVDYYGWEGHPGLSPELVHLLRERARGQIELKYFNVADKLELWNVGHRDHSKLMIGSRRGRDGRDALTAVIGSANIGDESRFVANSYFLFQEAEWRVTGPIVERMLERFRGFWEHKYSEPVPAPDPAKLAETLEYNRGLLRWDPELRDLEAQFLRQNAAESADAREFVVSDVTWVSDLPGKDARDRVVDHYLLSQLVGARKRVLLENYAALIPADYERALVALKAVGVPRMRINTNGFATEDSDPRMPIFMLKHVQRAKAAGIELDEFLGKPLPGQVYLRKKAASGESAPDDAMLKEYLKAGIHSKLWLFDDVVGNTTANFDPRSLRSMNWGIKGANIEMGLFVRDAAFADFMAAQMDARARGSKDMDGGGLRYRDGTPILVEDGKGGPKAPIDQPGVLQRKRDGKGGWIYKVPLLNNFF